jgi:hypothetical protein
MTDFSWYSSVLLGKLRGGILHWADCDSFHILAIIVPPYDVLKSEPLTVVKDKGHPVNGHAEGTERE